MRQTGMRVLPAVVHSGVHGAGAVGGSVGFCVCLMSTELSALLAGRRNKPPSLTQQQHSNNNLVISTITTQ